MSRGRLSKVDIQSKIYKLKTSLHNNEICFNCSEDKKAGAQWVLNELLDFINEYHS
jgi:hypothetical protein